METVVLNPDYCLKNDLRRIILYSKDTVRYGGKADFIGRIHPMQAMILSFFTYKESYAKCIENLMNFLHLTQERVEAMVKPFIENEALYTEWNGVKIVFPPNVLIILPNSDTEYNAPSVSANDLVCTNIDLLTERYYKGPHVLTLMLNNRCVTKCRYCYADIYSKVNELTTDEILTIIEDAKTINVSNIDLIGGEVFLKKDWHIILAKLVDNNMSPYYLSTKVPVTESIAKSLKDTGYNHVIQISLDSLDAQVLSELIGGGSNYIDKLLKGVEILQRYGFKIQVNTILTSLNCSIEQMERLYTYVKEINNLVYWEIRLPKKPIPCQANFERVKPNPQEVMKVYDFLRKMIVPNAKIAIKTNDEVLNEKFRSEKCSGNSFGGGVCSSLYSSLFILPDGKVTLCEELYWHPQFIIGDLKESSLTEVWNSEKANFFLNKERIVEQLSHSCTSCSCTESCLDAHKRCWTKIVRTYGASHWNYPDPRCERAPKVPELN